MARARRGIETHEEMQNYMTRLRLLGARLARAEDGIALILALVVMMVLSIMAISAAALVTSTQNTSSNERQGAQALTAGEAGLDLGANYILTHFNGVSSPPASGTTYTGSATVDSSHTDWSAVYSAGAGGAVGVWKVTSTAVGPNGKVKRVLQQTLQPCTTCTTTVQTSPVYSYGFVMGGQPHTGTGSLTPDQICALSTTTTFGGSGAITCRRGSTATCA